MSKLYVKFRQIFQPYYRPKPKKVKRNDIQKDNWWSKLFNSEDKPPKQKKSKNKKKKDKQDVTHTVDTEHQDLPPEEETNTPYDHYIKTNRYDYNRKLGYLVNIHFIDFMARMEEQSIKLLNPRDMFEEMSSDDSSDFMSSNVGDSYEESTSNDEYQAHMVSRIGEPLRVPVFDKTVPFGDFEKQMELPTLNTIWYYHDKYTHQVLGYFETGSGVNKVERSTELRRKLKPLIYPTTVGEFDRTHLIPFGYHESEGDNRLLIGWDSQQNRTLFNEFEQRQKLLPFNIYWLTRVDRDLDKGGVNWTFEIYNTERELVDKLESEMIAGFSWRSMAS